MKQKCMRLGLTFFSWYAPQDGLGGNSKTLMFVNISPADYNAEETATSLQYAARVKTITNDANKQVRFKPWHNSLDLHMPDIFTRVHECA